MAGERDTNRDFEWGRLQQSVENLTTTLKVHIENTEKHREVTDKKIDAIQSQLDQYKGAKSIIFALLATFSGIVWFLVDHFHRIFK